MAAVFGRSGDGATATENGQGVTKVGKVSPSRVRPSSKASKVPTLIAAGTTIDGDVRSKGPVHVEGRIQGAIESDDTVQVNSTGAVEGDIDSLEVMIAGQVKGNVSARNRVRIQEGCRMSGDIRAERIQIDEGARMEGHLQMGSTSD